MLQAGAEELFLWVTADLQGMLAETWFGTYYMGEESPISDILPSLAMTISVCSALFSKEPH